MSSGPSEAKRPRLDGGGGTDDDRKPAAASTGHVPNQKKAASLTDQVFSPDSTLGNILSMLDTAGLGSSAQVDKGWKDAVQSGSHAVIVISATRWDAWPLARRWETPTFTTETWLYSCKNREWTTSSAKAPSLHPGSDMVRIGRHLFFVAGVELQNEDVGLARYDPYKDEWTSHVATQKSGDLLRRTEFGTVSVDGNVYVICGKTYGSLPGSTVRCDPDLPTEICDSVLGRQIPPVNKEGSIMSHASVLNGAIYVTGGAPDGPADTSVERWIPGEDEWEFVADLNIGRWSHRSICVGQHVYVLGGLSKCHIHEKPFVSERSVERYCPKEDRWEVITELPTARSGFGVAVVGHCIYLMGGKIHKEGESYFDAEATDLVEIYDTKSGARNKGVPLPKPIKYVYSCASYLRFDEVDE